MRDKFLSRENDLVLDNARQSWNRSRFLHRYRFENLPPVLVISHRHLLPSLPFFLFSSRPTCNSFYKTNCLFCTEKDYWLESTFSHPRCISVKECVQNECEYWSKICIKSQNEKNGQELWLVPAPLYRFHLVCRLPKSTWYPYRRCDISQRGYAPIPPAGRTLVLCPIPRSL